MDCINELFRYSTHDCVLPVRLFFIRVNASSSLVEKKLFGEARQLDLSFPLESVQDLVKKMERAN